MINTFRTWYSRYFSDPQTAILMVLLVAGLAGVLYFGDILAPLLIAVVLAYLLESTVLRLESWGIRRVIAVSLVLAFGMTLMLIIFFVMFPILYQQCVQLLKEFPNMVNRGQVYLLQLPQQYPDYFSPEQVQQMIAGIKTDMSELGQAILSVSPAFFKSAVTLGIYLVLLPLLVFFILKDKDVIKQWMKQFLPQNSDLSLRVWRDVDDKIGNYVRGKCIEIVIMWLVMFITFELFGLNYAFLLSFLVGLSVIIPYIGAVVVTIPVLLIGFFQWGISSELLYMLIVYQILQIIDGNILVPLLFSEVVNLHPVAIIAAVLFFGGVWGAWGVFFAIPLATLIQAILKAWPEVKTQEKMEKTSA